MPFPGYGTSVFGCPPPRRWRTSLRRLPRDIESNTPEEDRYGETGLGLEASGGRVRSVWPVVSAGPDFTLDTIFEWEGTETFFARIAGVTFLALGWFDWLVASRLESRFDMVWPLVLVPALLLAVVVGQPVAGNYDGTEFFYWTSIAVTVFFTTAVGGSRLAVGTTETPAAGRTQLETG